MWPRNYSLFCTAPTKLYRRVVFWLARIWYHTSRIDYILRARSIAKSIPIFIERERLLQRWRCLTSLACGSTSTSDQGVYCSRTRNQDLRNGIGKSVRATSQSWDGLHSSALSTRYRTLFMRSIPTHSGGRYYVSVSADLKCVDIR